MLKELLNNIIEAIVSVRNELRVLREQQAQLAKRIDKLEAKKKNGK